MNDVVAHHVSWTESRRYGKKAVSVTVIRMKHYLSTPEQLTVILFVEKSVVEDAEIAPSIQKVDTELVKIDFSILREDNVWPELVRRSCRIADKIFAEIESKEIS